MSKLRIGFVLTGSFCTFAKVMPVIQALIERGDTVTPILSDNAGTLDTRFGTAAHWREELTALTGISPIDSIVSAEPIGPKALFDILIVAPCTGNTLARLAHGLTDTPATMAVKSHLRGERPVVLAVSTNDGLSGSAANLGTLPNRRIGHGHGSYLAALRPLPAMLRPAPAAQSSSHALWLVCSPF